MTASTPDWRNSGIRIVRHDQLDFGGPAWPRMRLGAAITHASAGAEKIWVGAVTIPPRAQTGAHHHGGLESVIYVMRGRARMRWGERLEYFADAGPGDFIYVAPYAPHQELNASADEELVCVLIRTDQEPIMVRLDIEGSTSLEEVSWVDPHHPPSRALAGPTAERARLLAFLAHAPVEVPFKGPRMGTPRDQPARITRRASVGGH